MSGGDRPRSKVRAGFAMKLAASSLLVLVIAVADSVAGAPQSLSRAQTGSPAQATASRNPGSVSGRLRAPVPWDDATYRATVVVRRGTSQGSGTIIASVDGDTLVLTASHVVKAEGPASSLSCNWATISAWSGWRPGQRTWSCASISCRPRGL